MNLIICVCVCVQLISPGLPCQNEINRIHTQSRRKSLIGESVIKSEIYFIPNNEQALISITHKKATDCGRLSLRALAHMCLCVFVRAWLQKPRTSGAVIDLNPNGFRCDLCASTLDIFLCDQ